MAASKHIRTYVNTLPQCSPASVGLAQARPNKICTASNKDSWVVAWLAMCEWSNSNFNHIHSMQIKMGVASIDCVLNVQQ